MKKIILAIAMFAAAVTTSFAQATPDVKTKEDYLRKSRHQKTAAWILLGGGALLTGIGIAAGTSSILDYAQGNDDANNTAANVVGYTGIAAMLGSIPLFIVAGSNKRKAVRLSFDMQRVQMPYVSSRTRMVRQPAVTFTVAL